MVIRNGSLQLFRLFGITVYLHWSWAIVAAIQISNRADAFTSQTWNVIEYLAIFLIVLTHEFGHSLACRSVGGRADTIMLWPLGGVAFVRPPMRPGATLWSIFAGPLVNIVLVPVTWYLWGWAHQILPGSNVSRFAGDIFVINLFLLCFNMLPVYPLDGGQILQSLLWFVLGFVKSLRIVSVLGFLGAIVLGVVFYKLHFSGIAYFLVAFILWQAYNGYRTAQYVAANPGDLEKP